MLKIRDDYDLQELSRRWGFRTSFTPMRDMYVYDMLIHYPDDVISVVIDMDSRLIMFEYKLKHGGQSWTNHIDIIYDLIQAGLVEKVKE